MACNRNNTYNYWNYFADKSGSIQCNPIYCFNAYLLDRFFAHSAWV